MRQVVGAAIVRDGLVLAARRASGKYAGRWEFPGGKVEPGESPTMALAREIAEELDCAIEVISWLPEVVALRADLQLAVAHAALVSGEPAAGPDHREVRWLQPDELDDLDWLDADVSFLDSVRALQVETVIVAGVRGIVFEEAAAEAIAAELRAGGYAAAITRERLAGEDDDEAHPWAVVTDAPAFMMEVLIDRYDGWLDVVEPAPPTLPPLTLPTAPRLRFRP